MTEENIQGIKDFNPKEFAANLADQAKELVPPDFPDNEKQFIVDFVRNFCVMSGEALVGDTSVKLNLEQAAFITQIIGEWTFHKSVDLVRAKVDISLREEILKKVAFTVFEICKTAVVNNMPPDKILSIVEQHVGKSFKEALNDLNKKGVLDQAIINTALKQSNIDQMAKEEIKKEMPHVGMSDAKILKLASLAFLIRNFPKEKIKSIISGFSQEDASVLLQYIKMDNLDEKLNPEIAARCLSDMKHVLPPPRKVSFERCYINISKISKILGKKRIQDIMKNERKKAIEYIEAPLDNTVKVIPAMVANEINNYLKDKIR